jgi:hypothetical protein
MVNIVVDFVEAVQSEVHVNVILNANSNHVKAEVARGAMDVKQNVELDLDAILYGVGEVSMSSSSD